MDDSAKRHFDQFVRTRDFAIDNAGDAVATNAALHTDKLAKIITNLTKAKASQTGGSAATRQVLLAALQLDIHDINRTAHAIGQETLGFDQLFPTPKQRNPAMLLTTADTYIGNLVATTTDDAATLAAKLDRQAKFIANGFAADFATALVALRAQIDAAKTSENNADAVGEENTAAIGRLVNEGIKECTFLDAIFHNVYRGNPGKLGAWVCANHLERAPKKKKTATPAQS